MRRRVLGLVVVFALVACEREQREFRSVPYPSESPRAAEQPPPVAERYQYNAYHISEGKRLYVWFNCSGCHAHGGGNIGPALMDDEWRYGGEPQQIFETIRDGRPNGMPSFANRIPEPQIWQLVAYIRSMGRHVPKDAAPGRADDLYPGKSEVMRPREPDAEHEAPP